jgi:scyllo-inositol 2-dehydrogenase (NADP+)
MEPLPIRSAIAAFGMSGQVFHNPLLEAHAGFNWVATFERTTERSRTVKGMFKYAENLRHYFR